MVAHLSIGTAEDRIDLLNPSGFMLNDWNVGGTEYGTIFQESQLADYRQMAAYRDLTVIDTFNLVLRANGQDEAARRIQEMRSTIRMVLDFWSTTYQYQVVYLATQASCETNMRYAVVYDARLVGESSPFGQPFLQPGNGTVMDTLSLVIERGPWLANAPGTTGTCVEIGSVAADQAFVLDFDGVNDVVNCGSGASVDNLPSANFTFEAWIKPEGWGESNVGTLAAKGNPWRVITLPDYGYGLRVEMAFAVSNLEVCTGLDDYSPDGEWRHVVIAYTVGNQRVDIALDGEWVDLLVQTDGVGAYVGDAADSLTLGNNVATTSTWDGQIGWTRISSSLRYTIGMEFTPPGRCDCPTIDGDTVALWCLTEGGGATAYDETANNNDGTIAGATWLWSGCDRTFMEATCEAQSVFVANKHNVAQLTDCYYWDNSGLAWNGVNLIGTATPFAFLPAVPAINDFVIFGIDSTFANYGPFSSLVLDIGTAIGAGATIQWRYYDGAVGVGIDPANWPALTVQDNTNAAGTMTGDAFDTTGIGSVHWEQPNDWATCNPTHDPLGVPVALGVTGYWVCAYITAGPAANAPTQDNRDIYTVTWPYIEFDADEVGGDMPALLRLSVDGRSAYDALSTTTDLWIQRTLVGLRSYDRGAGFTAYVNISDIQNSPDITIGITGSMAAFAANPEAPTGRSSIYTPGGAVAMATQVRIRLVPDFYGRFHAFVRGIQVTGNAGEVIVRLGYAPEDSAWPAVKHTVSRTFLGTADDQLLDFGEIVLGPTADLYPLEVSHTYIEIEAQSTAVATAIFYDLILIPVDEWAIDAEDTLKNTGSLGYTNDYWSHYEIDGIRNAKGLLSYLIGTASGKIARYWRPITNGLPILQTGKQQRLWFLCARNDDYADVDDVHADSEMCSTVQVWKNQRYSTLRGDQ